VGVIEGGAGPGGVVSGVEASQTVERDKWKVIGFQVEGLSHCARAEAQHEESQEYAESSHLGSESW
jgi:hypothetical protein